jgi:DNA invertase Pin-like site-specific DNA recombinase
VGSIYARYSSRYQDSIADQVRKCYAAAVKEGIFVPRDFVCYDLAVRGVKAQRAGLGRLRALLEGKAVGASLFFATNRLFRKTYQALQFVEEEVVERGIRAIFAHSGVDTRDADRWRLLLQLHAMMDEFVVGMYADHVRAGQEGLFARRLVFGTVSFGYRGVPIPGEFTKRKRPRSRLEVDPVTGPLVAQIFAWYVRDRLPISAIVRRLNDTPGIPLPPRCTSGAWTYQAVRDLLANPRYRGFWEYGRTQTVWQSKKDYSRQVRREEALRAEQIEALRIVPDELWYQAQARLAEEERSAAGRKPADGDRGSRPRLLNGLFRCPEHGQILYVGGVHGRYMFCKVCRGLPAARRPLFSQLPRDLALRLTCQKLAQLVQGDAELVRRVVAGCQEEARRAQQPDPACLQELHKREKQLTDQVRFLLGNAGETEADRRESAASLQELRRRRAEVQAELSRLEAASGQPLQVPDEAAVRALLQELEAVFVAAAEGRLDEDGRAAREFIALLVGGRIDLYQQGERVPQRGWLQGRFRVRLLPYLLGGLTGLPEAGTSDAGVEVLIDYREPPGYEDEAERAKQLYDQGLLHSQIAEALHCGRNWVTKLLRRWFESRGLPVPDGRRRRATLPKKQVGPTLYQRLADGAKALWDEGQSDVQIAARLGCSPPTAAAVVSHWYTSRGLKAPSHAERRAALVDRMQVLYAQGLKIREIARSVGTCSRTVTLLLRERFESLGQAMPDSRTRQAALGREGSDAGG